jgi:NADH-quinone oxidoreductase subunit K
VPGFESLFSRYMLLQFLQIGFILFTLGILGIIVNRKNIILMLMSIELTLLSVNFLLIVFSVVLDDLNGQLFSLFILCVAAAESAIGLSILVAYYRVKSSISVQFINLLKG